MVRFVLTSGGVSERIALMDKSNLPSVQTLLSDSQKTSLQLTDVVMHLHEPLPVAAEALGVCSAQLKRFCRRNNLRRWPFRKIVSVSRRMGELQRGQSITPTLKDKFERILKELREMRETVLSGLALTSIDQMLYEHIPVFPQDGPGGPPGGISTSSHQSRQSPESEAPPSAPTIPIPVPTKPTVQSYLLNLGVDTFTSPFYKDQFDEIAYLKQRFFDFGRRNGLCNTFW